MLASARIIVIDRDPLFRVGVGQALKRANCCEIVAEGASHGDAVHLCRTFSAGVLLIGGDLNSDSLVAVRRVAAEFPAIKTIVLTETEKQQQKLDALQAGASACASKCIDGPTLVRMIAALMRGDSISAPSARAPGASGMTDLAFDRLTRREREVLERVSRGLTNKEVARELKLSEKTIKHYMSVVMDKLQVRNRVEAVVLAKRLKLPE